MIAAGVLAQSSPSADRLFGDLLPTLGVLALIVLLGGGVAVWLRRRLGAGGGDGGVGFTLGDLRSMRDRGEISAEEFERAKDRMIAGISASVAAEDAAPRDDARSRVIGKVPPRRSTSEEATDGNRSDPPDGNG